VPCGSALPNNRHDRLTLRPSLTLGIVVLAFAACGPAGSSPPEAAPCGPGVPNTAQHPLTIRPSGLAGDYALVQVETQPNSGSRTAGRLHLSPLDTVAKAAVAGGAVRDLIGWLDLTEGDSLWRSVVASREAASPGVVLAGQHLRLGRPDYRDGLVHHLTITAVSPDGFWGWWKADRGMAVSTEANTRRVLPDPAGYFCALRSPT
jgi:hypothetical protein